MHGVIFGGCLMRGDKADEIERLEEGLARAGGDWLPKTIEVELGPKSPEDLLRLTDYGDRLEDAVKIRNGWLYIMLSRKVGHGNFKKYLEDHRRPYHRVNDCMNYARAVARHPALSGALAGRALRRILALPEPEIHKLEEAITGIPADESKKISRDWIEREHRKIQEEKEERGQKRRKRSPEAQAKFEKIAEQIARERQEAQWTEFSNRWGEACRALNRLAASVDIDLFKQQGWFDRIFDQGLVRKMGICYDGAISKMNPIDEFLKRKEKKESRE